MKFLFITILLFFFQNFIGQDSLQNEWPQLQDDVSFLADDSLEGRAIGSEGEIIAANYIASRYKELGLTPLGDSNSFFQVFTKKVLTNPHDTSTVEIVSGRNVIGYINNNSKNTIIVGAHYDHLGWGKFGSLYSGPLQIHNGADDNASGVAGLLYIAEKLKSTKLNSNVLFIAFTGEERGLLGSNFFINNPSENIEQFNFMINMDMIGRLDTNNTLAIYGVGTSPSFIPSIQEINVNQFKVKMDSSGMGPSDHTSFYINDIPVLHFFTGQHENYHKPSDDVEFINFEGLHRVSGFITNLIGHLDKQGELEFNKTNDKQNNKISFKVTLGIIPNYMFDGKGLKIDGVKNDRPAATSGMKKGDVIIKMGVFEVNDIYDYMDQLGKYAPGDQIQVEILRGKKVLELSVTF